MKKVVLLIVLLGLSISMFGKGTLTGVQTDANGRYQIYCENDNILEFSLLSFKTEEEPVGNRTVIDVVMKDEYWPPFEGRSLEAAGFRFWKGER